jgi:hypothetical protein
MEEEEEEVFLSFAQLQNNSSNSLCTDNPLLSECCRVSRAEDRLQNVSSELGKGQKATHTLSLSFSFLCQHQFSVFGYSTVLKW